MIHITFSSILIFFQDNSFPQVAVWQRVLLIIWFINNSYIRYISLHIRYTIVSTNLLTCVYLRCVITVFNVFGYFFAEINFLYINMYIYETFLFIDILDTFLDILLLYKIYTSFTSGYIKHYHTFNNTVSLPLDG